MLNTENENQMGQKWADNFINQRHNRKKRKTKKFYRKRLKDNRGPLTYPSSVLFQVTTFVFNGIRMSQLL